MAGQNVLHNHEDGHGLTDGQHDQLGIWVPDPEDGHWCYGQFYENGTYAAGHVLRHAVSSDLVGNSGVGTVTEAIAVGENYLVDTGEFANKDLKGAIGYVFGGTGKGQTFYVTEMMGNDRIGIKVLAGRTTRPRTDGWALALGTDSTYRLWLPGRFYFSDGAGTDLTAGAIQTALTVTADYKPYGWVKCEGGGFLLNDQSSANNIMQDGYVAALAGGLVEGVSTFGRRVIALADTVPDDTNNDALFLATLMLPRRRASYRYDPAAQHSGNTVNIV